MLEKDIEILTLWKTLTESEKKEVFRQLQEKLTSHIHIEMKERVLSWVR
ncbi:MAG: hypothetical protein IJZ16_01300 [Clostridia bacterium]|nr:hypothetical protein [Clostridia bacterium]